MYIKADASLYYCRYWIARNRINLSSSICSLIINEISIVNNNYKCSYTVI